MDFADRGTQDVFNGVASKAARRILPVPLVAAAQRKLSLLDAATSLDQLRVPPGNRLEQLEGDRQGQHSIRIHDQYRVCFRWTSRGAVSVEIVDYH